MKTIYATPSNLNELLETQRPYATSISRKSEKMVDAEFLLETARKLLLEETGRGSLLVAAIRGTLKHNNPKKSKDPESHEYRIKVPRKRANRLKQLSLLFCSNPNPSEEVDSAVRWLIDRAAVHLKRVPTVGVGNYDILLETTPSESSLDGLVSDVGALTHDAQLLSRPMQIRTALSSIPKSSKIWLIAASVHRGRISLEAAGELLETEDEHKDFDQALNDLRVEGNALCASTRKKFSNSKLKLEQVFRRIGFHLRIVLFALILGGMSAGIGIPREQDLSSRPVTMDLIVRAVAPVAPLIASKQILNTEIDSKQLQVAILESKQILGAELNSKQIYLAALGSKQI